MAETNPAKAIALSAELFREQGDTLEQKNAASPKGDGVLFDHDT